MIIQDLTLTRYKKKNSLVINKDIKSLLFQKFVVSLQRIKPVHLICYMLSYCTIKETDKGIGNANPLFFCLGKYPIYRLRIHQYLTNQVYSQQT